MNIFTDESGQFRVLENTAINTDSNYECVVAVILSDEALMEFEKLYGDKDKQFLRNNAKEIIEFLNINNCKAFTVYYDANLHSKSTIEEHKKDYILSIDEATTDHPEFLLESVAYYAKKLSDISLSEYIKSLLMILLLENIIRGIAYKSNSFVQLDLKNIIFSCDEVTIAIIPIIKYFSSLPMFLNSAQQPIIVDNLENLSHFIDSSNKYLDAKSFLSNISFVSSKDSIGVRIADVISNQIFRILNEESIDYDVVTLARLFSNNPYGFECKHFNKNIEFIDKPISENVSIFVRACR